MSMFLGVLWIFFAAFLHIGNFLTKERVFRNCRGFAKSNAKEILSHWCILSNAHCSSLTPLSNSFSLDLLGPVVFCFPLTWTRCASASCPCVMWACGSVPWHLRLLGSGIVSGLRFNLKKFPYRILWNTLYVTTAPGCWPGCFNNSAPTVTSATGWSSEKLLVSLQPPCFPVSGWGSLKQGGWYLLFSSLQSLNGTEFHPKVWAFKTPLPWDVLVWV